MDNWHQLGVAETARALDSDANVGISPEAATERLRRYGPNKISQTESVKWFTIALAQFENFLILILAVAAALSWLAGDLLDAAAILAIIVLNALLGFAQEWKAETALTHLKQMLSPTCHVIRGGESLTISVTALVQGDLVKLSSGNLVPADLRVTRSVDLKADESVLTGESIPVDKGVDPVPESAALDERASMLWTGTHVVSGHGTGLVVATGSATEFGRIAGLTATVEETSTRLQRQLATLARQITIAVIIITAAVMLAGWWAGRPALQMFMSGVSLAVAAVPEGLPAVVTITLALGVRILAGRRALLRHLQAAETLGATSVICTDKTGTLTRNEMMVQRIWTPETEVDVAGEGYAPTGNFTAGGQQVAPANFASLGQLIETAKTCNHADIVLSNGTWRAIGSPTEAALVVLARKAGLDAPQPEIVREFSFNSNRKRMSVIACRDGRYILHSKGAPEVILSRCDKVFTGSGHQVMTEDFRGEIESVVDKFASAGLRTLALAYRTLDGSAAGDENALEQNLVFLGIVGIIDPPRPEVAGAIAKTRSSGIRVVMMTGDAPATAAAIARQVGMPDGTVLTGSDLDRLGDDGLLAALTGDVIFARTVPEQKLRIVGLLQSRGELVAMTGDGVNDAPALKQADIGIAMGIRGTDVARGAADMVLMDDNFATIVDAIEEGRRQYANIRKFVAFLACTNFGEALAVFANILSGAALILLPIQILWVNLVTDSATALSLGTERAERDVMEEPPRQVNQPILDAAGLGFILVLGLYVGLSTLGLYHWYLDRDGHGLANTVAFTTLVLMSNIGVMSFRSLHQSIFRLGILGNLWLLLAIASMIALQAAAIYVPFLQGLLDTQPMQASDWLLAVAIALPTIMIGEAWKFITSRLMNRGASATW
ncbi:MAG: HAD-IC family P-type ATPase [Pseudomonadales bacterium]|nr:HAD-IC family P-type ATPase [Pseudomonadales bacterium]